MRLKYLSGAGLALLIFQAPAYAQTAAAPASAADQSAPVGLEEVVVTAQHRSENLQSTATSVSVRSGDDLRAQGKFSLREILEDVPGISGGAANAPLGSANGGTDSPAAGLVIRGVASNEGPGGNKVSTATAAAIYVDGVYNGIGGGYDIDRVEALRGPQGTLYGRSATAGLVAIHTRDPDLGAFGGFASAEVGSYALTHIAGALNVPINDVLAVRISANQYKRDGYDGNKKGGQLNNSDGRVKILYRPNEDVALLLGAAINSNIERTGGHVLSTSTDRNVLVYNDVPTTRGHTRSNQYWAELNWNTPLGALTYLPAYRKWHQNVDTIINGVSGYVVAHPRTPKDDFWTHELRLSSSSESRLRWQVGAFYYKNDLDSSTALSFGPTAAYPNAEVFKSKTSKSTENLGAFAELTYPITDTLRVTGGLRYDHTEVQTEQVYKANVFPYRTPPVYTTQTITGDAGRRTFGNWTYKLRLEKDLSPENLLYASVSTGFSPGDVTAGSCPNDGHACAIEIQSETLTSYEIGSKNRFLDNRLQLNGDVYYSDYGAFQTAGTSISTIPGLNFFATLSVPLKVFGAELETLYRVTPADRVTFNLAYTDAKYGRKDALVARFIAEDRVAATAQGGTAPFKANLAYEHTFSLPADSTLSLRGDVRYTSASSGHLRADQKAAGWEHYVDIDAAATGNLSATWQRGDLAVTGYVRNITDYRYFTVVSVGSTPPAAPTFAQSRNDPRTYGLTATLAF